MKGAQVATETATDQDVTPEAYQRVIKERDAVRKELGEVTANLTTAEQAIAGLQLRDRVYDHLAAKEGVRDAFGVAKLAVNDAGIRGAEAEKFGETVDAWLDTQHKLFGATATEVPPEGETEEPAPPVPAVGGPSPAGDGTSPGAQPLSVIEWQQKNPGASVQQYAAARQAGEVVPATQ